MTSLATNMGAVERGEVETFWKHVEKELDLGYNFSWTSAQPSICIDDAVFIRESIIGEYPWAAYQEVLHEVAHLYTSGHGPEFHGKFASLIRQFLGE